MITQKFKSKFWIEGSHIPVETVIEAVNQVQAKKILEGQYKIKSWIMHPYPVR